MNTLKKVSLAAALAICAAGVTPAFASDLKSVCMETAERDAIAEGEAGCDCMVTEAGDNQAVSDELIAEAPKAPEERSFSADAQAVVDTCFPSLAQ